MEHYQRAKIEADLDACERRLYELAEFGHGQPFMASPKPVAAPSSMEDAWADSVERKLDAKEQAEWDRLVPVSGGHWPTRISPELKQLLQDHP